MDASRQNSTLRRVLFFHLFCKEDTPMNLRFAALVLPLAAGLACADQPTAPRGEPSTGAIRAAQQVKGTGLVLNSVTGLDLPLIGQLGDVTISQAAVTNFAIIEN